MDKRQTKGKSNYVSIMCLENDSYTYTFSISFLRTQFIILLIITSITITTYITLMLFGQNEKH